MDELIGGAMVVVCVLLFAWWGLSSAILAWWRWLDQRAWDDHVRTMPTERRMVLDEKAETWGER